MTNSPEENKRLEIYKFQLEQTYSAIQSAYSQAANAVAILLAAEATLVTFGIDKKSSLLIFIGGVALLLLVYMLHRGGKVLGVMACIALSLEKELSIDGIKSLASGFIISFRGYNMLQNLNTIAEKNSESLIDFSSKSSYSIYRPGRSKVTLIALLLGIVQVTLSIVLYFKYDWPF